MNNRKKFIINKPRDWCIDIILNEIVNFYVVNLYLIFKSYMQDESFLLLDIYVIGKNNNEKENFHYKRLNLKILKSYSFNEFYMWIEEFINSEKNYLANYDYYGFRFIFSASSPIFEKNEIYPIYPWNKIFFDAFISESTNNKLTLERLSELEKENERLRKKCTTLYSEYIRYRNFSRHRK